MAFKDGDFVKVEYSAWRVADGSLVYTTDEKKAREAGIFDKDFRYGPRLVVLGKGMLISGLENAIKGMNLKEKKTIELEPKDAYGERNEELVRVMPIADFRRRDIDPYPGLVVDIDGLSAIVKSVNSGRVLVDANHPLAGEKVRYEVTVVDQLTSKEDKALGLAEMYEIKPTKMEFNGNTVKFVFGNEIKKDDAKFLVSKLELVNSLFRYMDDIEKVITEEEYQREKEEAEKKN